MCRWTVLALVCLMATPLWGQMNVAAVVDRGRQALGSNDPLTAIGCFNDVITVRPRLAEAYYYRGAAKFTLEDYTSAEADCNTAVTLNPFHTEFWQLRGLCRINTGDYEGAANDYAHVIEELPDDQPAYYNSALCFIELHRYDEANKMLDATMRKWPQFSRPYLVRAELCMQQKDTLQGMLFLDTLLCLSPREYAAWGFKGRYALNHDDYRMADSCLTQAIKWGGRQTSNYLARAEARHALNLYNLALEDYDQVIRLIPQHFVAHYNRGLIREAIGDDDRAVEDFDFILNVEPDNTLARLNRAQLLERTGQLKRAESDYTALLRKYPRFYAGYAARARLRRLMGNTHAATDDETVIARAQFDLVYGNAKRHSTQRVRRGTRHALDQYQDIMVEAPDSADSFMAEIAGKVQNRPVERTFLPALDLSPLANEMNGMTPDDILRNEREYPLLAAKIHYNRGCEAAARENHADALREFEAAIRLDKRMGEAYYNRALCHLLQGLTAEAPADLSMAGELGIYQAYPLLKQTKLNNK